MHPNRCISLLSLSINGTFDVHFRGRSKEPMNELKVLLIEPVDEEAEQVKRFLRRINAYDVSVQHVRTADDALAFLHDTTPDLVLFEHQLNGETALELARDIRSNHQDLAMMVVTDDADVQNCTSYFHTGVDDYLEKSQLDPRLLHARIKRAISERRARGERRRAARFDDLTDLYNRRFTFQRIHEEMTSAARHNHSFSLCLVDLDGFKNVNDQHGHICGDLLLKRVSERIRASVRTDDIVGRYGGDEFLVGLRQTDSAGAYRVAQKLIEEIGQTRFDLPEGDSIHVNCSVGVAELNGFEYDRIDDVETVEEFVERADQALYVAKEQGAGTAERRRQRRIPLDEPIPVYLEQGGSRLPAQLVDVSRNGVRLDQGPFVREGRQVTLVVEPDNGDTVKREGTIRSCQQQNGSSKAVLGVETDIELPGKLIDDRQFSLN
jgi:diguanylate cyclase (GGDEF)-like protein